jgi:hypothetical protein
VDNLRTKPVDLQIFHVVEIKFLIKSEPVLVPREPGSDLTPSPEPPEVGAVHNLNSVVPRNGCEIVCDRLLWIAVNIFGMRF